MNLNKKPVIVSYELSHCWLQEIDAPHTVGEDISLKAAKIIKAQFAWWKSTKQISKIICLNNTFKIRINEISGNMKDNSVLVIQKKSILATTVLWEYKWIGEWISNGDCSIWIWYMCWSRCCFVNLLKLL